MNMDRNTVSRSHEGESGWRYRSQGERHSRLTTPAASASRAKREGVTGRGFDSRGVSIVYASHPRLNEVMRARVATYAPATRDRWARKAEAKRLA
jgi:hypothetical protein